MCCILKQKQKEADGKQLAAGDNQNVDAQIPVAPKKSAEDAAEDLKDMDNFGVMHKQQGALGGKKEEPNAVGGGGQMQQPQQVVVHDGYLVHDG